MVINLALGNSSHLRDSGYSHDDEKTIYDEQLKDVYLHSRWYLDNLTSLKSYRVRWHNYRNRSPPVPYCLVKETRMRSFKKEQQPSKYNED